MFRLRYFDVVASGLPCFVLSVLYLFLMMEAHGQPVIVESFLGDYRFLVK